MRNAIEDLKVDGFWYMATVYSKHAQGLDAACEDACKLAGALIKCGLNVYSPVAHCHPIALAANIDPRSHAMWLAADKAIFDRAHGLLVMGMAGWRDSYGIAQELEWCATQKKPRFLIDPKTLSWQAMA